MNFIPLADATFEGTTLVLPTVSIGSVPQLAVDLLINAPEYKFRRVGYLDASDCVPFVSPAEPGTDAAFSTALEGTETLTSFPGAIRSHCGAAAQPSHQGTARRIFRVTCAVDQVVALHPCGCPGKS